MKSSRLQLALREWRQHLLDPLTLTALGGVTAVLALVGPFGTIASLSLPERAAYWGLLVVLGYAAGYLISYALLQPDGTPSQQVARGVLAGVLTGLAMTAMVTALNIPVFGFVPALSDDPAFVGTTIAISVIVMAVIDTFNRNLRPHSETMDSGTITPPLLDRLPCDKRGALVAISVEDHYVRVRTTKGEDMLLMRLADAIREVGKTPGDQVHRSHRAAFDHVTKVTKHSDRATLHLTGDVDSPVSRSNLAKLREAGLLP